MKKLPILIVLLLVCAIVAGCTGTTEPSGSTELVPQNPEDLLAMIPEDVQRQIKHDYLTQFYSGYAQKPEILQSTSLRVFGVFDDTYVLFVDGAFAYLAVITSGTFGLTYPSSQNMYVYRDGHFYCNEEAEGILTSEEERQVVCNYYNAYPSLKGAYGSNDLPAFG